MIEKPALITFDMFGTVVDWRTGLEEKCAAAGRSLRDGEFDRIVDFQGQLEQDGGAEHAEHAGRGAISAAESSGAQPSRSASRGGSGFLSYAEITRRSLVEVVGLSEEKAAEIGANVGKWPLYPDSRDALRALLRIAPCAAMTNSDRIHGEQLQSELGFRLSDWLCAEDVRAYKPDPAFWHAMGARRGISHGPSWWHVSAYTDYDLAVARALGLTTVFVRRPHARSGEATLVVKDLAELAERLS